MTHILLGTLDRFLVKASNSIIIPIEQTLAEGSTHNSAPDAETDNTYLSGLLNAALEIRDLSLGTNVGPI